MARQPHLRCRRPLRGPVLLRRRQYDRCRGHTEFDAVLVYEIAENATLQANARNLFDKKYVAYGGFGADFYNTGQELDVTLRYTW